MKTFFFFVLLFLGTPLLNAADSPAVPASPEERGMVEKILLAPGSLYTKTSIVSVHSIRFSNRDYLLASVHKKPGTEKDYGLAFFLFQKNGNDVRLMDISKGAWDSDVLDPSFFRAGKHFYILGRMGGCEGSWGFQVHELTKKGLRGFDTLNAMPACDVLEQCIQVKPGKKGIPVITMTDTVKLDPGGLNEKTLRYRNKPFLFIHDGSKFVPK